MRIVSGKYKGKRFDVPHTFKARPTTDFAKEGLFNILSNVYVDFDEEPFALDLFSGTGSISLEFLSRGCGKVVSIEKDFKHYQFLQKVAHELNDNKWHPLHADVFKYLNSFVSSDESNVGINSSSLGFDIVFADPPYALENLGNIPDIVFQPGMKLLNQDGLFILEHGKDYNFEQHPHFIDHRNYGSVNFSFFK